MLENSRVRVFHQGRLYISARPHATRLTRNALAAFSLDIMKLVRVIPPLQKYKEHRA